MQPESDDTTPDPKAPETDAPDAPSTPPADVEGLQRALTRANKEAERFRLELKTLKPLADRAKELEDAGKSETEKLVAQLETARAEGQAASNELARLRAVMAQAPAGTPLAELEKIARRLQGTTPEELEADAKELLALLAPGTPGQPAVPGQPRPVESLKPGALPTPPAPDLAGQIAAATAAGDWAKVNELNAAQLAGLMRNPTT